VTSAAERKTFTRPIRPPKSSTAIRRGCPLRIGLAFQNIMRKTVHTARVHNPKDENVMSIALNELGSRPRIGGGASEGRVVEGVIRYNG
jgi:hypothetical protein